jgi:CO dehydrogenase/acetyl-CoA synthase delta subunit
MRWMFQPVWESGRGMAAPLWGLLTAGAGVLEGGDLSGLLAPVSVALPDVEADLEGVVAVEVVRLLL